ncbi:conserved hypothetical protein [Clostridium carboxidivorans P7]|uniref:TATA-box binding protein n=1 Tax=Clostridium carboxidivorans P7 TaxID=536227 RepID=C6PVC5_9CLOT|nr:hypothetical protein [Clostridium carboxidivorans]EET86767.1 conserved hypothetical protein [Clostridium carboxidivorans P7]
MKKKKVIFLTVFFIIGIILLISDFSLASKDLDLFNDILQITNSKTVEYGITASFITDKNGEKVCNDILKKMSFIDAKNKSVLKNEKKYCIEFGKNNTNGYIETMKYENHNIITINLVEKSNKNLLNDMKRDLEKCIDDGSVTVKYYQYLKSQVYDDVDITNDKILKTLKNHGASNITTVALKNGYSSTLYTGLYDAMQSNGKLMDFNYAVCKYNSGNYIIMGTPEILTAY